MVTYIYFVKCPNCEDEHFDFFDDAKAYARGCMSQKPIITQTEVNRNDFGECTDSCDLGTIWSWEDECEPEVEPTTFSKDDIKADYDPDNDPEFQDNDITPEEPTLTEEFDRVKAAAQCMRNCYDFYEAIASKKPQKEINKHGKKAYKFVKDQFGLVDDKAEDLLWSGYVLWKNLRWRGKTESLTEATMPEFEEIMKLCKEIGIETGADLNRFVRDEIKKDETVLDRLRSYRDEIQEPLTEAKRDPFHEAIFEAIDYLTEFNDIFSVPENIGADTWKELKDDINYGLSSDFEIAEIIMEYLNKDLAISRKHPEMFEDDPQSELTLETYNRLKRAYDRAVEAYKAANPEDFEESCKSVKEDFISLYDHGKMTKDELYDHLVNKGDEVEFDIGDQRYSRSEVGSFSDGGYYSNSLIEVAFEDGKFIAIEFYMSDDGDLKEGNTIIETDSFDELWDQLMEFKPEDLVEKCTKSDRKPVPEGMTIKQLKETMEENEDMVECAGCEELFPKEECFYKEGIGYLCGDCEDRIVKCTWCEELYDKGECRYEVDLGWLCSRCEAAIKSRGETLTFREGNYWDFLDEEVSTDEDIKENYKETTEMNALSENTILDEAYFFRHLTNEVAVDAKQEIINELDYPITNGKFNIPWTQTFYTQEAIVDFNIFDGQIEVVIERIHKNAHDNSSSKYTFTLELSVARANARTGKPKAKAFLEQLKTIADKVNRNHNIGVAARRDNVVRDQLNDVIANELRDHITKIEFRVPLIDEADFGDKDSNGEPLTPEAEAKLTSLYSSFFSPNNEFAEAAEAAGMVDNRRPEEDTNSNIASSWKLIGKIAFDCKVGELSPEAQNLINVSRVNGTADLTNKREIDCVRLAIALIKHFNNNVRFYETVDAVEDDFFNQEF